MAEPSENKGKGGSGTVSKVVSDYVNSLSGECRLLVTLKAQLYGGKWPSMLDDLRNRLTGKPYIFKLAHRIEDDIERIELMIEFEAEHDIDLADYVELQ